MSGYTAAVLVLGVGLIVLKIVVGYITSNGHDVPWPMWVFGGWTHLLLTYVVVRNGGSTTKLKEFVKEILGKSTEVK
jgi:hypothetical protein